MALQSVFAQGLHFGSGHTNDPNQDKNHEREDTEEGDEDLEEGEIADDDEEEPAVVDKLAKNKSDDKKEETKSNGSSATAAATTASKTVGVDKSDPKFSSAPSVTTTDSKKREPKRRARKRGSDDEHPDSRDVLRKRRRNQDNGEGDDDDADMMEMMNVRGHSPSERERSRFDAGDYEGSDFDGSPSIQTPARRSARPERSDRLDRSDRMDRPERSERSDRPERIRAGGRTSPRRRARGNSRERERDRRRGGDRDRDRDRGGRPPPKSSNSSMSKVKDESICAFYMEGKCSRGSDCPYSHAALPPRKMELCKFYLMDCCAKKEKCLYMHKDFPCKYFHTGKKCRHGAEDCKFSHDSLSETTRAILIKHIETAPREILGDFPRLTRDETIQAIDNFSPQGNGRDKRPHIPSLFDVHLGSGTSQPMKADTSTKEVAEERTGHEDSTSNRRIGFYQDTTVDNAPAEENRSPENSRSIWFGQLRQEDIGSESQLNKPLEESKSAPEHPSVIGTDQQQQRLNSEEKGTTDYLATLPRRQRELFLRIQQQQREPASLDADPEDADEDKPADDKWYSSDEEGEGRSLSDVLKSIKREPESQSKAPGRDSKAIAPNIDLGSLENINVAEIAKVLSALQSKSGTQPSTAAASASSPEEPPLSETGRRDPRIRNARPRIPTQSVSSNMGDVDLRMQSRGDVDLRLGSAMNTDVDLRGSGGALPAGLAPLGSLDEIGSADIDLRRFGLPFKPIPSHPPAREIDASYNSHPPIEYQVYIVDCEPLNYGLVRVHADWAHLDPRLQRDHSSERTSYSGSDVPSIPLGPASPDPVVPSRHYEPEPATFSSSRWAPNDPRSRDPRRAAAAVPPASSSPLGGGQHTGGSLADPRGKPGLLGAAPPGMLPYGNKSDLPNEPTSYGLMGSSGSGFRQSSGGTYDRMYDGATGTAVAGPAVGGQHSPRAENRRDPRQRLRNPPATMITDTDTRSYTPPPPNERVFR